MGAVAIYRNVRIVIYSNDHPPAHVHAIGPGVGAVFFLESLELRYNDGFGAKAIFGLRQFIGERRQEFLEIWHETHPQKKD